MDQLQKLAAELQSPDAINKFNRLWRQRHKIPEADLLQMVAAIRAHDKYLNLSWCKKTSKRYQSYLKLKDEGHEAMTFFALWNLDEQIRQAANPWALDLWLAISRDDSKTLPDIIRRGEITLTFLAPLQPAMNTSETSKPIIKQEKK